VELPGDPALRFAPPGDPAPRDDDPPGRPAVEPPPAGATRRRVLESIQRLGDALLGGTLDVAG